MHVNASAEPPFATFAFFLRVLCVPAFAVACFQDIPAPQNNFRKKPSKTTLSSPLNPYLTHSKADKRKRITVSRLVF
jgi:hypothetical protein